ncbi:isochorismatase family protein [Bdellovibrio sp. HCB2-146]|uniref:isochorismatase family protein n=1 Tax=Bdellovibrio sp. HCB2-146 TaxID=3394362 RepID=UPI0039BC3912
MAFRKSPMWDADDCALIIIDYQAEMFSKVRSSDPALVELGVRALARGARAFNIPVILSTVGVQMGVNKPTIEALRADLPNVQEIDRSSMNAWEDEAFQKAVKATGKKRLIFCALWTEICLAFPVVDALADGYEVAIVVDAVGGQSKVEHEMAVWRMVHAGAVTSTTAATIAEWFRDWKSPRAAAGREIFNWYLRERRTVLGDEIKAQVPRRDDISEHPSARH